MSADNWTKCPACQADVERKLAKDRKDLDDLYGKIPAPEYLKRSQEIEEVCDEVPEEMREDYCIGIRDGRLKITYSASCYTCKREFKFKYDEPVELK